MFRVIEYVQKNETSVFFYYSNNSSFPHELYRRSHSQQEELVDFWEEGLLRTFKASLAWSAGWPEPPSRIMATCSPSTLPRDRQETAASI